MHACGSLQANKAGGTQLAGEPRVAEADDIKEGHVPDYTPTAPLPADGPPVITVSHQGPGHEKEDTHDCQGGNPSSSSTTTLQYRDVFVLSWDILYDDETDDAGDVTRRANGAVRGLRQAGVPVLFVKISTAATHAG
nr:hypothetical protein BaRGS_022532 [Batillaria attramentaria]